MKGQHSVLLSGKILDREGISDKIGKGGYTLQKGRVCV